jgi:hypothetical protein
MARLVTEETLAVAPPALVASALARVEIGQAALALGTLPEAARGRVLASLPRQHADAIHAEAEVLSASGPRRDAARRALCAEVARAARERELDLTEINLAAWREAPASEALA